MAWLPAFRYLPSARWSCWRWSGWRYWWQRRLPALAGSWACGHAGRCCCGGRCPCMPLGSGCHFGAVALLTLIGQTRSLIEPVMAAGAMKLQLGTIRTASAASPLCGFFERASWVSPFANLLAVPVVTFLVVPSRHAGHGALAALAHCRGRTGIWLVGHPDHDGAGCAVGAVPVLAGVPVSTGACRGRAGFIWALLAAMCLFQPFHPRLRVLAPLFLLPVFLVHQVPFPGSLRVSVLDVGQGLAVLLETGQVPFAV
jgi:competence protein ComEC